MANGTKPHDTTGAFRRFWELGYQRLLPVSPPGSGIINAGKRPGVFDGECWRGRGLQTFEATEADLPVWGAMGAGVGLRTGRGIVALDIDSLSEVWSEKIASAAHRELGQAPVRIGRKPKQLLMYRAPEDTPYMAVRFDDGVNPKKAAVCELLAGDKYFNADTIHPQTGKPYEWASEIPPFEDLPVVSIEQWESFFTSLRRELPQARGNTSTPQDRANVDQESLRGDPELIRAAMAAIPNRHELFGYHQWRDIATALRAALPEDQDLGEELFVEFSDRTDLPLEDIEENPARIYRSMNAPFSIGARLIYDHAEKLSGWQEHKKALFDPEAAEAQPPSLSELFDESVEVREKGELAWIAFNDAAATAFTHANKPLVKGLLDQGAMTVLYGESNTGKTFVAMDMGYHIATGRRWGGMATTRCVVAYIVAEGGMGARKRAAALLAKHGPTDGFHYLLSTVDLLDPKADLVPLCQSLKALKPGIVFVDTLSRVMAGGDENSSVDMGALVRHFDLIRQVTGAHLVVVHHTGKDLAKGARGHSLLRAATDTEIEITEGQIRVTKQRDLDREWSSSFVLESMVLGVSEIGDVVTSAVVDMTKGVALAPPDGLAAAIDMIRGGEWRYDVRAGDAWAGAAIGLALGLSTSDAAGKARVVEILDALVKEGRLYKEIRLDKHRKSRVYVVAGASIFD